MILTFLTIPLVDGQCNLCDFFYVQPGMNKNLLLCLAFLPALSFAAVDVAVRIGPPPPRRVVVGVAPHPGYVWTDGYWRWDGAQYVWVPGVWMRPPHARARWVPAHWAHRRRGYVFVGGHWR